MRPFSRPPSRRSESDPSPRSGGSQRRPGRRQARHAGVRGISSGSSSSTLFPSAPAGQGPVPALRGVPSLLANAGREQADRANPAPAGAASHQEPVLAVFGTEGALLSVRNDRQELLCSVIGLLVKLGLIAVAGVSLMRLAGAYQQRMERQGEITAVLELESAKLAKARERFDTLFRMEGEQRLIREQSQWIAPNRLRVVWQDDAAFPTVQTAHVPGDQAPTRP